MITIQEAKELAILAHKGQCRRPRYITKGEFSKITPLYDNKVLEDGSRVLKGGIDFGFEYVIEEPYHNHPIAVASMLETDEEKIVGYLHDVIEDTSAELRLGTSYCIEFKGEEYLLSNEVFLALKTLTKEEDKTYSTYIRSITHSKLTTKVKIADITSNLLDNPSTKQIVKYRKAMKVLLKAL